MSYELNFRAGPGYMHATVTGQNSRENVQRYLAELLGVCKARGCSQVLIEERLEGPRVGTLDAFEIAAQGSRDAHGYLRRIAYVDVNAQGNLMRFAETVAVNRGLPVRVFASVADAEKWLQGAEREPAATRDH